MKLVVPRHPLEAHTRDVRHVALGQLVDKDVEIVRQLLVVDVDVVDAAVETLLELLVRKRDRVVVQALQRLAVAVSEVLQTSELLPAAQGFYGW